MKKQLHVVGAWGAALALLLAAAPAAADSLAGRVLDPDGAVVAGARVRLFDRTTGELRQAVSTGAGRYVFEGIPAGEYLLEADAASTGLTGSQAVAVRGSATLDLELRISGASVEVFVTASSTPVSIEEVGKAVDVVDSEEIALRNEFMISEAVRNLPGIRVQTQEGPGSSTTIQTRGLRAADTALLVDGMRFRDAASPQSDATSFIETMTATDVERIEFLRGSGSSLYGSNAVGGVINITSRQGGGPPRGEFRAEGGGLGMIRGVAGLGGGVSEDRFTYSGALSHLNITKGVRDGIPYRNTNGQGTVRHNLAPGVSLTGRLWAAGAYLATTTNPAFPDEVRANFPATGPVPALALPTDQLERFERDEPFNAGNATFVPNQLDPDSRRVSSFLNGGVTFQHQAAPGRSYRVAYQGVDTNRTYLNGPARRGPFDPDYGTSLDFDGRTDTFLVRTDVQAGAHNLFTVGYELEREGYFDFNTDDGPAPSDTAIELRQYSHAFYGQDQIRALDGQLTFTLAGRMQLFRLQEPRFSGAAENPYAGLAVDTPGAYTGDVAVAYFLRGSQTKLRTHVGNSFRSPSTYERFGAYYFFGYSYIGDPRLKPERAIAVDGGIDQWLFGSRLRLSGTYFYTELRETVFFENTLPPDDPFSRFFGGYANGGGGVARGVEWSVQASPVASTRFQAAYTYTNSDSRTPQIPPDFHQILGLSDHTFTLTATQWITRRFNVTFDFFAASEYSLSPFGAGGRQMIFDGPVKGDVMLRYDVPLANDRSLEIYGKVENVFNQHYYEDGYLGPGAWSIAGFRWNF